MNKIEEKRKLLKKYYKQIQTIHGFNMYDEVSSKALNNALLKYGKNVDVSSVIALYDNTISQNGKQGFLFTDTKVCYLEVFEKPKEIYYADILTVIIDNIHAKKDSDKYLKFVLKNGQIIEWKSIYFNKTPLYDFFSELIKLDQNKMNKKNTVNIKEKEIKVEESSFNIEEEKIIETEDVLKTPSMLKKFQDVYDNYRKDYAIYISSRMIPEKKLVNAINNYASGISAIDVICLIDISAAGDGKEGYLFTENKMYWCVDGEKASAKFDKFKRTEYLKADSENDRYGLLKLYLNDGSIVNFRSMRISKIPMQILLDSIIRQTDIDINKIKQLAEPKKKEEKSASETKIDNAQGIKANNKNKILTAISTVKKTDEYKKNINKISLIGGHVSERSNSVEKLFGEATFSGTQGHGYAAERANHIDDIYRFKRPQLVGSDLAKNGPDRLVDGLKIQTKYCKSAKNSIDNCFNKDEFRYVDCDTGKPMIIEVPKEQYEEAVVIFENKIREGKVPGVSEPADAKKYIKKGSCTYKQAVNIAKAGTIDSIVYDAKYGAVYATQAMGISTTISFALSVWNGEKIDIAMKNAVKTGLNVFGRTFAITVVSSQIARTSLNAMIKPCAEEIVKAIGSKASKAMVNGFNQGTGTMSKAVINSRAVKLVQGTIITTGVTILVISTKDIVNMFRGRISQKQLFKNLVKTTATTTAATVGGIAGKCIGSYVSVALFGPVCGSFVKPVMGFAGSMVGAMVSSAIVGDITNSVLDQFVEDDANEMQRIIENRLKTLADDYCICHEEMKWIVECISCGIDEDMIMDIYSSNNRASFVDECIVIPCIEAVISDRVNIKIPCAEDYFESVVNVLEEIDDEINELESEYDNFTIIASAGPWNFIDRYSGKTAYYTYVREDIFSTKNGINFDSSIEEIMSKLPVGFMEDVDLEKTIIYQLGIQNKNKDVQVLKKAKKCYTYVWRYYSINFFFDENDELILIGYLSLDDI